MRLIYHPHAEAELIEAAQFYERRVPTLGAQFLDAADRAIRTIQEAHTSESSPIRALREIRGQLPRSTKSPATRAAARWMASNARRGIGGVRR